MVKLTITIAAAVAAAAVLVEGSSDPGSPLSPHSQFLRDGRSGSNSMGLSPSDSDTDVPPPHDYDRELSPPPKDRKRGGKLRSGHRHPPPATGNTNMPFGGSDADPRRGRGSGSFDDHISDAGKAEMPSIPDRGPFQKDPKDFGNGKPNKQSPPPPSNGKHDVHRPDGGMLPHSSGVDSWNGSGSTEGRFPPPTDVGEEGHEFPYDNEALMLPPPPGSFDGERMPPKHGDRRGKPLGKPDENQRPPVSTRADEQPPSAVHGGDPKGGKPQGGHKEATKSQYGSGSFNGRFSHAGSDGNPPSTKREHEHEAGTEPSGKLLLNEGSGSLFPKDGSHVGDSEFAPPTMVRPQ
ncbi:uncharacterized protein KRP23_231 [Phytophthora ramorum]|uniref:uncharacterized protein n=1 Tax=Phytophthora ramorum TaxID=164328 RepID=UPI00309F8C2A|nr:hypothetical protein KRP23_231 [Phytophthora ramorum]